MATAEPPPELSQRAKQNGLAGDKWVPLVEALFRVYSKKIPNRAVLMGIAENALMRGKVAAHIKDNLTIDPDSHFTYGHGPQGLPTLRAALADLFDSPFAARNPMTAREFVITSGVSSVLDAASWCLCNEGEGVLVPFPLYTGFTNDIPTRSRGRIVPLSFAGADGSVKWEDVFDADANLHALEAAKANAEAERTTPANTIKAIADFCAQHGLHYISDEIYALSTFPDPNESEAPAFQSVLSIDFGPNVREDMIHVLYGGSKDFGANGLRLGTFHTRNEALRVAVQSIITFAWPNCVTQDTWARMLLEKPWLDNLVDTKQNRLAEQYGKIAGALDARGVEFLGGGNPTMFLWTDLAAYVSPSASGKGRRQLENDITVACRSKGVMISRAANYQAEIDGWFRITFMPPDETFHVGLERLFEALDQLKAGE